MSNSVEVLNKICNFYYPNSTFPLVLNESDNYSDENGLSKIATLLDQNLSLNHLTKNDLIFIISDGRHGRHFVDFLYREKVFYSEDIDYESSSNYQFIYPIQNTCRSHEKLWLSKSLNPMVRKRALEVVKTKKVITDSKYMQTSSIFLLELKNTSKNALPLSNALLDTISQKKAKIIFVLLQADSLKSMEINYYMQSILSIVEGGQLRRLHLFVQFTEEDMKMVNVEETLNNFNSLLRDVLNERGCIDISKKLSFHKINVPHGIKLIEHLLGVEVDTLNDFYQNLKGYDINYIFFYFSISLPKDFNHPNLKENGNSGMNKAIQLLKEMNQDKVSESISRLSNDIDHLLTRAKGNVMEYRKKELKNSLAIVKQYVDHIQTLLIFSVILISLFIHAISGIHVEGTRSFLHDEKSMISTLLSRFAKYSKTQWLIFYFCIIIYYLLFGIVGTKYFAMEELDQQKIVQQRKILNKLIQYKEELNGLYNKYTSLNKVK
ncbi:hypothetical protein BdWA1_002068 [Babesia duncani]|uniref:Uncharacterized protein n=1 Tax=Babesia duncani TaxID=323732 RepID=A0AAD9PLB5_9APIC|nr:hypothetical protein BdWA1_002068 [Babesia duncani]